MPFITRDEQYTNHDTNAHVVRRVPIADAIAPEGFHEYAAMAHLPIGGEAFPDGQVRPVVRPIVAMFDADSIEDAFEKVDAEMKKAHRIAAEKFRDEHARPKVSVATAMPTLRFNGSVKP